MLTVLGSVLNLGNIAFEMDENEEFQFTVAYTLVVKRF